MLQSDLLRLVTLWGDLIPSDAIITTEIWLAVKNFSTIATTAAIHVKTC